MSEECKTVKVKPTSADQGDFVVINEADFDAAVHQLFDAPVETRRSKKSQVVEAES